MPDPIGTNNNGTEKTKTEAPTSGSTKTAAQQASEKRAKLTEDEFDFVNLVHQHYSVHGTLFTGDFGRDNYGLPVAQYKKFMDNDTVKVALREREIPMGRDNIVYSDDASLDTSWRNLALSAEQILVANTMLDLLDQRSYKKKLQDLGVTTAKWTAWCKEPAFAKYLDDNTQSVLRNGQHEAALALMDKVSTGDMAALKFYYEYTDRFVSKASPVGVTPQDAVDAKRIIQSVVEIVVEEVTDKDTAARIADRLRQLMVATQIANGLTAVGDTVIIQPEVVANRTITPEIERAISRGAGME